jgi:murein peptide amidase A
MRIQSPFSVVAQGCAAVMYVLALGQAQAAEPAASAASTPVVAKQPAAKPQAVAAPVKPSPRPVAAKPAPVQVAKPVAKPVVKPAPVTQPTARVVSGKVVAGKVVTAAPVTPVASAVIKPTNVLPAVKPAALPPITSPQEFCAQATRAMPSVNLALCARAQLSATTGRSVWGRTIFQRDVTSDDSQLRVLVIGGIHGDERSSSALVLHWIQLARQTPMNVHWRFVPLINPDGMLISPPRRTNANGVDLNRNFPTPRWDKEAPLYWTNRTKNDPRRYPGPKPLSEPESRWIHDEMERWKPNLIVSIHAPYGVLDFDGPTVPPQRLGRLYLDQVGIYPGSLGNFGGIHKRVPVVTIELPSAIAMPSEAETRQMWLDLLRWMGERLGAG